MLSNMWVIKWLSIYEWIKNSVCALAYYGQYKVTNSIFCNMDKCKKHYAVWKKKYYILYDPIYKKF